MAKESISIIIPTLNEEDYIGNLLSSLVYQTHKNFEVIVVDGKSKDKTKKKVLQFQPLLPQLRFIESPQRGIPVQRNSGAQKARHKRLLFLDADVILPYNFLEKTLKEIEAHHFDLATPDSQPMSDEALDKLMFIIQNLAVEISGKIKPSAIFGWAIFSTKKAHKKIDGFDPKFTKFGEDSDYLIRAAERGFKFGLLKSSNPYVSTRRINYEGRLSTMRKGVLFLILTFLMGRERAVNYIEHPYGRYAELKKRLEKSDLRKKFSVSQINTFFKLLKQLKKEKIDLPH